MAWPGSNVSTANVDSDSDRIGDARADIKDAFDKLNAIIDHGPNLSDLDDVSLSSPVTDQVLTYNGTYWTNADTAAAGLTELLDDTSPQLGGDLDMNGRVLYDSTRNIIYISDGWIARGYGEWRHVSDGPGNYGRLQAQMKTTTGAEISSTNTATAGLTVKSYAGQLVLEGNDDTYIRSAGGDLYHEVNGTSHIYYRGPMFLRNVGDTGYTGGTGQISVIDPAGEFLIQSDANLVGIRIEANAGDITLEVPVSGNVNLQNITISQATGVPGNTTTPTGYMQININGTTRYVPYYT